MTLGKFRLVDLGDLPWAKELELMCPVNKLGKADIYVATHHGLFFSGSPALVHGIAARLAIMENSAKKGGSPSAWDIVHSSPGLAAIYQLHWSDEGGKHHNSRPKFLANLAGPDTGYYLKLTAYPDGGLKSSTPEPAKLLIIDRKCKQFVSPTVLLATFLRVFHLFSTHQTETRSPAASGHCMNRSEHAFVIGGGPAGLVAAIALRRKGCA